jgi:Leucine-rich repeat (LRR) protein
MIFLLTIVAPFSLLLQEIKLRYPVFFLLFITGSTAAFSQLPDSAQFYSAPIYKNLNEALEHPDKVYRLDLSKKKLKVFPMEILQFKNLQELNLSKNKLDFIPEQIGILTHLQILNLSGNRLQELPDSIGELINLKKLVVSRNLLRALPKRIGDLQNLEILDLWQNDLSVFPEEMSKMKKLRWMDLRVILLNDEDQERIRNLLPNTKIFFSPSCKCVTG